GSTGPTFSGSWKGTKSVHPGGQSTSLHASSGGTSTTRSGGPVPNGSSSRKRAGDARYQASAAGASAGGAGSGPGVSHATQRWGASRSTSRTGRGPELSARP